MKPQRQRKPRKDPIEEMAGEPLTEKERRFVWTALGAALLGIVVGSYLIIHYSH